MLIQEVDQVCYIKRVNDTIAVGVTGAERIRYRRRAVLIEEIDEISNVECVNNSSPVGVARIAIAGKATMAKMQLEYVIIKRIKNAVAIVIIADTECEISGCNALIAIYIQEMSAHHATRDAVYIKHRHTFGTGKHAGVNREIMNAGGGLA